jgi:hypothetical protein
MTDTLSEAVCLFGTSTSTSTSTSTKSDANWQHHPIVVVIAVVGILSFDVITQPVTQNLSLTCLYLHYNISELSRHFSENSDQ